MAYLIKPIETEAEILGKAYVHYAAWGETYTGLMPQEYLAKRSLRQCEEIARAFPENTLAALDGDKVAGFISYLPRARDFASVHPAAEIVGLYVLKAHQGLGLGGRLLDRCLELLPGKRTVLFVLKGNAHAIGFYRHRGFRFTGKELTQTVIGGELTELEMLLVR